MSPTDEETLAEWRADPIAAQKRWIAEEVERIRDEQAEELEKIRVKRARLADLSALLFQNKPQKQD